MGFIHPRHRWLDCAKALTISVEGLSDLYRECRERIRYIPQNNVVVTCLDDSYSEKWIFGDYIDFDQRGFGLYQAKNGFKTFFQGIEYLVSCGKNVFVVMPQPHPVKFDVGARFTYLEFPEFYGIYHDLFSAYYGDSNDAAIDFSYHYLFLNKRNRPGRQQLFCELVDRNLINRGLVSFLGHGMGLNCWFDEHEWVNNEKVLQQYCPGFDIEHSNKARKLVPYRPDERMRITDTLCMTGGWIPELSLIRDTFIDIVFETHENQSGATVFTEKIFRSIYLGKPFVVFGGQNFLGELRKLGFETFDRWIDESYDFHENPFVRTKMIADVINDTCSQSLDQCRSIRKDMQPVIEHNQQRLRQLSQDLKHRLIKIDDFLINQFNYID